MTTCGSKQEIDFIYECAKSGFVWIDGIHGIGKTTIIREALLRIQNDGSTTKYVDLRQKSLLQESIEACLLHELTGLDPSGLSKQLVFKNLNDILLDPK